MLWNLPSSSLIHLDSLDSEQGKVSSEMRDPAFREGPFCLEPEPSRLIPENSRACEFTVIVKWQGRAREGYKTLPETLLHQINVRC